jgi:Fe-S-cluster containining protein
MEPDWLGGGDAHLTRVMDEAVSVSERRAGARLDYGRGCPACCLGPFPINRLDALRLRRGLAILAERDPERAGTIVDAAQAALRTMAAEFPGDAERGVLVPEPSGRDAFFARFGGRPCPALELRTGRCQLYAWRPVTCRTFGPPVHLGGRDLEACDLCFHGTPAEEDECRVAPDAAGLEDALLDRLEAGEGDRGDTIIAYALARPLLEP